MKKKTVLVAVAAALFFTACKKEEKTQSSRDNMHILSAVDSILSDSVSMVVTNYLDSFYHQLKDIKDQKTTSDSALPAEEAAFLVEGIYNYYLVQQDFLRKPFQYEFSVTVPTDGKGFVTINDVSKTFYSIRDSLVEAFNNITGNEKGISLFDIELGDSTNGNISFKVHTSFTTATIFPTYCNDKYIAAEPEHVWLLGGMFYYPDPGGINFYVNGQTYIDPTTHQILHQYDHPDLPGAYETLRYYGVGNYNHWYCNISTCSYFFIDVSEIDITPGEEQTSPISQYKNIPGYGHNKDIWEAYTFYANGNANSPTDDPDLAYKSWLTRDMMNFYITRIPANIGKGINIANMQAPPYVSSGFPFFTPTLLPPKTFYDFGMSYSTCLCAPAWNTIWNHYVTFANTIYQVVAGRKIKRKCTSPILVPSQIF